jgi:hypothetical protein
MQSDVPPEILKAVPGTLGALVALRWISGTPMQRVTSFAGGVSAAYYGAPHVANLLGVETGLAGFLVGLFGMAIAAKVFEAIVSLNISAVVARLLRKWGF